MVYHISILGKFIIHYHYVDGLYIYFRGEYNKEKLIKGHLRFCWKLHLEQINIFLCLLERFIYYFK